MFFCFFWNSDLYFLIPLVISEIFIAIAELAVPNGIPNKVTRTENETQSVTAEFRIIKHSVQFKILQTSLCFLVVNSFCFISSMK